MKKQKPKIVKNFLKCILSILSFLTIRNRKKWVIGSILGFSDNCKYFFLYVSEHRDDIDIIWIGEKHEVALLTQLGYKAYHRWGMKGIWCTLTAGTYIYSSYIADVNLHTFGRAKKVNLWHGVGIKNIEFKITSGKLDYLTNNSLRNRMKHLIHFVKPDVFLSTSAMMTNHFAECFRISKDKIVEASYPRCSIFDLNNNELRSLIWESSNSNSLSIFDSLPTYNRVYLYMPTWRDTNINFIEELDLDFAKINLILKQSNDLLIIKLHPATKINLEALQFSNITVFDTFTDIYPFLPLVDILITDYSSIYYDFLLLENKKTFFYIPDYDTFIKRERDLAYSFSDYTAGIKISSFERLLEVMSYSNLELELIYDHKKESHIRNCFWSPKRLSVANFVQLIDAKR